MIPYNKTNFFQTLYRHINNLFRLECLIFAIISTFVCYIFVVANENSNGFKLQSHLVAITTTLSVYGFFLAVTLSFRLNSSFNLNDRAFNAVSNFNSKSLQFLTILFSSDVANQHADKLHDIKNNISFYIGIIYCISSETYNGRSDTNNLREHFLHDEKLREFEHYQKLFACCNNNSEKKILEFTLPNTYILNITESHIRLNIKQLDDLNYINDLQAAHLNMMLSEITNIGQTIYNIGNVPIVHVYNQFINFSILVYILVFSIYMASVEGYYAGFFVFIWSYIVFIADNVATQIATPFGCDENDMELEIIYKTYLIDCDRLYGQLVQKNNLDIFIY